SELMDGIPGVAGTKGAALVETPDFTFAARAQYDINDYLTVGVQGKYIGDRFSNDINTELAPSFTVVDANGVGDRMGIGLERTFLKINATNILDESYLANISSSTTGTATFSIGAPQPFQAQIRTQF